MNHPNVNAKAISAYDEEVAAAIHDWARVMMEAAEKFMR